MNKDFKIKTIKVVTGKYPAVIPYLKGRAVEIYCEHKAVERDPEEPGRDEKIEYEQRLQAAIFRRLRRQFEAVKDRLNEQYKTITVSGLPIDDEGDAEFVALIMAGIVSGVDLTSAEIGIYLADGSVNARALVTARNYVTEWMRQLDSTSEQAVRDAIETFITKPGTTVGDVVDLLTPTFGETRSWRIAVTETTRVYAEANALYGQELLVQYPEMRVTKKWFTNNDDRVCPICAPLHNMEIEAGETFGGIDSPPAHVNCRCWTAVGVKV